jgi:hypothetical protein
LCCFFLCRLLESPHRILCPCLSPRKGLKHLSIKPKPVRDALDPAQSSQGLCIYSHLSICVVSLMVTSEKQLSHKHTWIWRAERYLFVKWGVMFGQVLDIIPARKGLLLLSTTFCV